MGNAELKARYEWLKKDINLLNKSRKSYKYQSEWHRLMWAAIKEIEILESLLK